MTTLVEIVDVLYTKDDRFLLVQHRDPQAYGLWGLPGGHVEPGETSDKAITREVAEELGFKATNLTIIERFTPGEDNLIVTSYIGTHRDEIISIQHEELIGYGWFTLSDIQDMGNKLRSSWILPLVLKSVNQLA